MCFIQCSQFNDCALYNVLSLTILRFLILSYCLFTVHYCKNNLRRREKNATQSYVHRKTCPAINNFSSSTQPNPPACPPRSDSCPSCRGLPPMVINHFHGSTTVLLKITGRPQNPFRHAVFLNYARRDLHSCGVSITLVG